MMWSNKHIDPAYKRPPLWAENGIGQNEFPCLFLHVPTKQNGIAVAVYSRYHACVVYSTDGLAADLPRDSHRQRYLSNCGGAVVGACLRWTEPHSVTLAEIGNQPQRIWGAAASNISQVVFVKVNGLQELRQRTEEAFIVG